MKRITLWESLEGWYAEYSGEEASFVRSIFGTTMLLTGYTAGATKELVVRELAARNPGYEVV